MLPDVTFDPTMTVVAQKSYARFIGDAAALVAVPGTAATDLFTKNDHGFINGQVLLVTVLTGLTGLTSGFKFVVGAASGTFQVAATSGGTALLFTADGTATITPVADFVGKTVNYEQAMETVKRKVPDANGVMRTDREVLVGQDESFKFEIEEVKWLDNIFPGRLSGLKKGRVQLYITDPDDAANTVAILTNLFTCTAKLDGGIGFKNSEVAKATIVFEAHEEVTVEHDASTA